MREEDIIELLKNSDEPLSIKEISQTLGLTMASTNRTLAKLVETGKIEKIGNERRIYYVLPNQKFTYDDLNNAKNIVNNQIANSKGNYEELEEKIKEVEQKIDSFYTNIISIMGVFVAIFALITSNAKIAYDLSNINENICNVIVPIIVTNVTTILAVGCLLLFIKIFIKKNKQ